MLVLKRLLVAVIVILLLLPAIQRKTHVFTEPEIHGYFRPVPEPNFWHITKSSWLHSQYQDSLSLTLESHIGLRRFLFRIHNQYDFSLFHLTHAEGFIAGKGNQLYEEDYIREYTGDFFIGKNMLDFKLRRLKEVRDSLLKYGTKLLVVFEPGKASVVPEYIPDHYHPERKSLNNYEYMTEAMKRLSIPYLDLNRHFMNMRDTSRYPLFPPYGMHWSIYGMTTILDTLARFIEKETGHELPTVTTGPVRISQEPEFSDNDIGYMLNVICKLPPEKLAYRDFSFSPIKDTLNFLVIADSYFVNIELMASKGLLGKNTFWYYNSKVYPHINVQDNPIYVDKSDLTKTLKSYDVVLLMSSEINLHCVYWNFPDEAWLAFHPGVQDDAGYVVENRIRNEREWFRFMVSKAKHNKTTLEEVLHNDGLFVAHN